MSDKIAKTIQHYESMTSAEILAELDHLGVDARPTIAAVKAIVDAHKHRHGLGHVHQSAAMSLGIAGAISRGYARPMATSRNHAAALQRGFFSPSDEVMQRLQHSTSTDVAYIDFHGVTELAIEASRHHELWSHFATELARACARWTVPAQCVAVHSMHHWLFLGTQMHGLATAARHELHGHQLSDDAHALLAGGGCGGIHAMRDRVLEELRTHGRSFNDTSPHVALVETLHDGTSASFIAIDALSDVLVCAIDLGHHDAVKHWVMDHIGRGHPSHFVTLQSLARVRDEHPRFAAGLFADVATAHAPIARQIAFLMIVEGYERSFRGVKQLRVPRFHHGAHPHFARGTHHELDLFGHRVCESHVAHELEGQMAWANRRLSLWN